jgi:processive 1,2-diacylglycerol beta-glucosyltransferase
MASALAEAFRGLDRNLIVREADMLDLLSADRSATEVRYELDEISKVDDLFGKPLVNDAAPEGPSAAERISALERDLFGDHFDHAVVEKRPDHIVLTHWLALHRLASLKEAGRLTASVTMVIAEPDIHPHWVSPVIGHYIVANDYVKTRLVRRGVAEEAISVCGVPVSPAFAGLPERDRQRQALGLRGTVVAVRIDGFGAKAVKFVRGIIDAHAQSALVIAAGRGEAAVKELQALDGVNACTLRVVEGPEAFRDVISTVDLVVTRANQHSAAECMAAGVPMLLIRPQGSTEERMADRLLARGIAARANCEEDFADLLAELLRNRRALQQMQDLAMQGRKPTAAQEAVDRIARLVR